MARQSQSETLGLDHQFAFARQHQAASLRVIVFEATRLLNRPIKRHRHLTLIDELFAERAHLCHVNRIDLLAITSLISGTLPQISTLRAIRSVRLDGLSRPIKHPGLHLRTRARATSVSDISSAARFKFVDANVAKIRDIITGRTRNKSSAFQCRNNYRYWRRLNNKARVFPELPGTTWTTCRRQRLLKRYAPRRNQRRGIPDLPVQK